MEWIGVIECQYDAARGDMGGRTYRASELRGSGEVGKA